MAQTLKPKTGRGAPTNVDITDREIAIDLDGPALYVNDGGVVKVISGTVGASPDTNIDGGFANSVYLASQLVDGGTASG